MTNKSSSIQAYIAVVLCVLTVICSNAMTNAGLTVLDEPLLKEFGWAVGELKLRDSINFIGAAMMIVFVGYAVDRIGYKPVMLLGLGLLTVVFYLYGYVSSLTHIYLLHIAIAVVIASAGNTVAVIAASAALPERRGMAIGLVVSGTSIGGMIMPNLTNWLNESYGWRAALRYEAIIPLVLVVLVALLLKNHKASQTQRDEGLGQQGYTFAQAIKTPQYYLLALGSCFAFFTVMALFSHLFLYARGLGFDMQTAALTISVFSLGALIGKLGFGWLSDRGSSIFLLKLNMVVMLVGIAGVFYIPQLIWGFVVLAAVGWGGLNTLFNAVVLNIFGVREPGKILTTISVFQTAGAGFGAAVAGWLFDLRGDYSLAFAVTMVIMLIACFLIWGLRPPTKTGSFSRTRDSS